MDRDRRAIVPDPRCAFFFVWCSLRQSMRNRTPTPTSGPEESTVQIDVEEMKMDVDGVSLRVYDCAGQVNVLPC